MTTQTYKVTGMHCGGCKRNVERIANNYGKDSQVDVEKWTLTMSSDSQIDIQGLKADLAEMDFILQA